MMYGLHAGLSPLLVLEDELAWAEIFDETGTIATGPARCSTRCSRGATASTTGLGGRGAACQPTSRRSPKAGASAGGRGQGGDGGTTDRPAGDRVAHVLPLVGAAHPKLHGLQLDINVPPPGQRT